jgi:putative NADPH-quinone reductase
VRAVVIVVHPDSGSFSHAVARQAEASLSSSGHTVIVHDLYAEGFRPAMSIAERQAYHSPEPVISDEVAQHVADIRAADMLVFVYPTWWSGLPAMLKGWLDRVMLPGVAFRFDDSNHVQPALTNVKRLVGISTYGSRWLYVKLINDNGRRTLLRTVRLSTGLRTRSTWMPLYRMDTASVARREAFLRRIDRKMSTL